MRAHSPKTLHLGDAQLAADLLLPAKAVGLVVFAHGSGSSRSSPRNQQVARYFEGRGLASLLFDLLTEPEQRVDQLTGELRFDLELLSHRLLGVVDEVAADTDLQRLRLGLFGASTGAAAALATAAQRPRLIHAVVCRGGRSDLAGQWLARVEAPTLQLVGARDPVVVALNRESSRQMHCQQQLIVIPGATHLFEEPGTMEQVCRLAGDWFSRYLGCVPS